MEIVPFNGWERTARLVSGTTEILVTLDVGPRVISYGFTGGSNVFVVHAKDAGKSGDSVYHTYGGHRLWIAPEEKHRTLTPDNGPVEVTEEGGWFIFRPAPDSNSVQREVRILPDHANNRFVLDHRITNLTPYSIDLAPWSLSQMAPGGELIIPTHPFVAHSERLLPVSTIALWGYTNLSDPRWTFGQHVVRLKQTDDTRPQKAGFSVKQGMAAYSNGGTTFLKRFSWDEGATYPDLGVNFEAFTRHDMLEVESLGPMRILKPGETVSHREAWYLIADSEPPAGDQSAAEWIAGLAETRPL